MVIGIKMSKTLSSSVVQSNVHKMIGACTTRNDTAELDFFRVVNTKFVSSYKSCIKKSLKLENIC